MNRESPSHSSVLMGKLKHTGSRHSLRQEDSEKPASSNFLSSVLSAAQNVTSVLRGSTDHKRTSSDGAFLTFINEAAQPFDNPLAHLNNGTRMDYEEGEETPITKVSDIKIEPIRSAISTLGKGELSLESLGLTPDENPSVPMHPPQGGHYPVQLNREESLRVPDPVSVSIKEPYENRRQSLDPISPKRLHRTRHSLITRPSEKTKLEMPVRSQSVNSSSRGRRSRGSFSEDPNGGVNAGAASAAATAAAGAGGAGMAGAGPYNATSAGGASGVSVPAFSSSALPDLEEKYHANVVSNQHHAAYDSDDSDRPKARADLDTGKHLAGFAYANKKRNQDFHKLFRSLPPNDFLLDDFSCALSREILIQGRMYVSERNICFNSNILGWVTNLIISFDEIVGLEKKTTAGLFPNGIVVQTLHARSSFASFISRDTVFEFLMSIWRQTNARPDLMNGTIVEGGSNDFLPGFEASDLDDSDVSGGGSDVTRSDELSQSDFDEFDSEEDNFSGSDSDLFTDDEFGESARQAKPKDKEKSDSAAAPTSAAATPTASTGSADAVPTTGGGAAGSQWPTPNLGAETHASSNPHYDYEAAGEKLLLSDTVMAPLGVVANLLFGDNVKWVSTFITDKEKNIDLKNMAAFEGGLGSGHKRAYEYIKPLGGPVGPKQTRCLCTDTIEEWDLDSQCIVVTSTQTPDVPSGGVFTTKTRYTLFWGDNNTTTVLLTYLIDWTGKSWFKSPIEKGTQDGQMAFAKNLIKELNETIKKAGRAAAAKSAPSAKTASAGAGAGGKRPRGASGTQKKRKRADSAKKQQEPVTAVRRIVDLLVSEPFSMVPVPMWAFVLLGLVLVWTFQAVTGGARVGRGGVGSVASGAHDYYTRVSSARMSREQLEMIRLEEEYNVWRWIDDRANGGDPNRNCMRFNRALYHEQNLQEAIKLTELRVQELKRALDL